MNMVMHKKLPRQRCRDHVAVRGCIAAFLTVAALSGLLSACASGGVTGTDPAVVGDDKGGKIAGGVGEGNTAAAMRSVTAHCAKYGKKAFITQMESPAQGGLMAFVCLER